MRPGDIILVRSRGLIRWLIRVITRSRVNHVQLVVTADGLVLEATPFGGASWGFANPGGTVVSPPLTDAQRAGVHAVAKALHGIRYSFGGVLALGLAQYGVTPPSVKRKIARPDELFCSQLADVAWMLLGFNAFTDGRTPQDVTPGDLDRLAAADGWPRRAVPAWPIAA